jgi:Terminase large subunit, T4likevirus-type, N-terminal
MLLEGMPLCVQQAVRLAEETAASDRDPAYDWYGESCPCGVEPGECKTHKRARLAQRPPEGDWRTWAYIAGRGAGKTDAGAHWIHHRVQTGLARRILLIAPTAADMRAVMVEGPSGLLATAPPWCMPVWRENKRQLTWPNGAVAICTTGEEPNRARGHNVDTIWADELAAWQYPDKTWDLALLALRAGSDPQAMVTTTPKAIPIIRRVMSEATTQVTTESTFANRSNLAPAFVEQIVALYEKTRLGRQEIYAEILELIEDVWFETFDEAIHVSEITGDYIQGLPVHLAIDCGTSRVTGAVFFQVQPWGKGQRIVVFGDFLASGHYSRKTALMIQDHLKALPCKGVVDRIRVDPASNARTSIGIAAYHEYAAVFGERLLAKWPSHGVVDGLDFIELLLDNGLLIIHPRCKDLISSFKNYKRETIGGVVAETPEENQHPHGDMMDALRGGIRDVFPEGRGIDRNYSWMSARQVF